MSWLGLNGSSRDDFQSLGDAYASMYAPKEEEQEQLDEGLNPFKKASPMDKAKQLDRLMKQAKDPFADTSIKKEAFEAWYDNQLELGADFSEFTLGEVAEYFDEEFLSEKKKDSDKCGDDTYWDKEEKKCKSKKKSSKTVVVGRGGIYGPGYHGGGGSGGDGGDGGDTDGGDGGDGGGDGGGGGGE